MVVKNRTYFAVMIDKSGNAVIFNDLDTTDDKLTFDIDIEGYAIFIYFVDGPAPSASALAVTPSTPAGNTYIVQPGDTLGQIADKLGITAVELASINEIKNLNLIYPGQTIRY
ncbi:MAG: LysM peptidoglycan-binding domain-containing protein [Lachnospiraceae bacterium]|nr:LysM peptidoglycan-binding domain-containing protein [Lachnospiraceae bacterium]